MKKTVTLFLLMALLLSAVSCGKTTVEETSDTTPAETEAVAAETKDPYADELPAFDFEGYEYKVQSITYDPAGIYTLFESELTGEVLSDSLYTRNREVEERFNIRFVATEDDYWNNESTLKNMVLAGSSEYDMIMLINRNAFSAGLEGQLMPTELLTYMDPTKPYYIQDVNKGLSIGGKSLFYYSEESIPCFEQTMVMAYNKDIAENNGLGGYYEMVAEGTWTFDQLMEDAQIACQDLDGDGKITKADQYGLLGPNSYLYPGLYSVSGEVLVSKDKDDIPFFSALTSEKFVEVALDVVAELQGDHIYVCQGNNQYTDAQQLFASGHALFLGIGVGRLAPLRDMESDYGILPYPKYEESQVKYPALMLDGWLHVVPASNPDPERTSVILEALASGSARIVYPAYYEKVVTQKICRDQESIDTLEIIRANRIVDLGITPWNDQVRVSFVDSTLAKKSDAITSWLAKATPVVEKCIADAFATLNGEAE